MTSSSPLLSIVIPVYNEEETLPELYKRLTQLGDSLDREYEIILSNDGSRDNSWAVIQELSQKDPHVKGICLSRNFGHQVCLTAGLEHASGDLIVMMDADLQDPPELIPKMIRAHEKGGFDVVYAVRQERKGETWFKKMSASLYYRVLQAFTQIAIPVDTGDFRLITRQALDCLLSIEERDRFIRGLFTWIGFKQTGIKYKRDERFRGETNYPLRKMVRFAIDGITSFSRVPLQAATWLGFIAALMGFVYALNVLWDWLTGSTVPGWASLSIIVLFFGGVQLITLGVLGEYIGRIFDEVKRRPLYFKKETTGFEDSAPKHQNSEPQDS